MPDWHDDELLSILEREPGKMGWPSEVAPAIPSSQTATSPTKSAGRVQFVKMHVKEPAELARARGAELTAFVEICRTYPFSSFLLVFGPFIGAVLTAASAYQGLKARLSNDQQAVRIAAGVESLSSSADIVRTYEAKLESQGQRSDVLKNVIAQYDQTQTLIGSRLTGKVDTAQKLGTAERALAELNLALRSVKTVALFGGEALIMRIAPNTFSVTLPAAVPNLPKLAFSELPAGTVANLLEPSRFGFTVVFTPSETIVPRFGITIAAEH